MSRQVLIIGYGYSAYYIACELLKEQCNITAWSRTQPTDGLAIHHQQVDLDKDATLAAPPVDTVYYLAPPPRSGHQDPRLRRVLPYLSHAKQIIYIGSSGVYGAKQGQLVTENSELSLDTERAKRRADAEQQLLSFCAEHDIKLAILRSAGIYGPKRIPIQQAQMRKPLITEEEAPFVNYIYVNDIARVCSELPRTLSGCEIFNLCDGEPQAWGESQRLLSEMLNLDAAPRISLKQYYEQCSPMAREFLAGNKRLSNNKLKKQLGKDFTFTKLQHGIMDAYKTS